MHTILFLLSMVQPATQANWINTFAPVTYGAKAHSVKAHNNWDKLNLSPNGVALSIQPVNKGKL